MVFILFFILLEQKVHAQNSGPDALIIEEVIENILQNNESEEFDFDTYFEIFTFYADHPINLNKTSSEELHELLFLSENQISNFFAYLKQEKKLISIYELQAIPGFDLNTIYNLLPFVKVSGDIEDFHVPLKELIFKGQHQIFLRYAQQFPDKEGFSPENTSASKFLRTVLFFA